MLIFEHFRSFQTLKQKINGIRTRFVRGEGEPHWPLDHHFGSQPWLAYLSRISKWCAQCLWYLGDCNHIWKAWLLRDAIHDWNCISDDAGLRRPSKLDSIWGGAFSQNWKGLNFLLSNFSGRIVKRARETFAIRCVPLFFYVSLNIYVSHWTNVSHCTYISLWHHIQLKARLF